MDLLDFLSGVMKSVGQSQAKILSADRTPETNAMLARQGFRPAENSLHLYGRALDVHFGDKLADAMKTARAMQRGGVGWYPNSDFMHIDTGPVRNWDIDKKDRGTLLVGNRKIQFDKHGRMLVAKGNSIPNKVPAALRGEGPLNVGPAGAPAQARARRIPGPRKIAFAGNSRGWSWYADQNPRSQLQCPRLRSPRSS